MLQNLGPIFRRPQPPCPRPGRPKAAPCRPPTGLRPGVAGELVPERIRTEASIRRAHAPSCYRMPKRLRWKWTTTRYYQVPTGQIGVEGRVHLIADSGWSMTLLGAAWAVSTKLVRRG